jgi:hypothetical protein
MKIDLIEYNGCFSLDLIPETVGDAARILRLAKNGIKEVRGINAHALKSDEILCSVVIGKRRRPDSKI